MDWIIYTSISNIVGINYYYNFGILALISLFGKVCQSYRHASQILKLTERPQRSHYFETY